MSLPVDDRGFLLGDGVFETVLARDGSLIFWNAHVQRLTNACAALGLPAPDSADLLTAARAALADSGLQNARAAVRLTWTAGSGGRGLDRPDKPAGRLLATAARAPEILAAARLITAQVRRNDASPASRLKTLSYLDNVLARAEATRRGADEALMLNTRGEVACAAAGNIVWLEGGALFTPALDCGVLDGVVRGVLVGGAGVEEVRAEPEALRRTEAIFLTNSLNGVRPVAVLDGRVVPQDRGVLEQLRAFVLAAERGGA